jgi:hypothetical protein
MIGSRPDPSPTAVSNEVARLSENVASCSKFRKIVLISAADITSANDGSAARLAFGPPRRFPVAVMLEELSDLAESTRTAAVLISFFDSKVALPRTLEATPLLGRRGPSSFVALVPAVSKV